MMNRTTKLYTCRNKTYQVHPNLGGNHTSKKQNCKTHGDTIRTAKQRAPQAKTQTPESTFNTQKAINQEKNRDKYHTRQSKSNLQHNRKKKGATTPTLSRFGPNLAAKSVAHEKSSKSNGVRGPSSSPSAPAAPASPASTAFAGRGCETFIPSILPAITALKPSGGGWVNGDWPIFTSTASPSSKERDGKKPGSS